MAPFGPAPEMVSKLRPRNRSPSIDDRLVVDPGCLDQPPKRGLERRRGRVRDQAETVGTLHRLGRGGHARDHAAEFLRRRGGAGGGQNSRQLVVREFRRSRHSLALGGAGGLCAGAVPDATSHAFDAGLSREKIVEFPALAG